MGEGEAWRGAGGEGRLRDGGKGYRSQVRVTENSEEIKEGGDEAWTSRQQKPYCLALRLPALAIPCNPRNH